MTADTRVVPLRRHLAWAVLGLVFLDELLAMTAAGVWGAHVGGWPLAVVMPVLTMLAWFCFASPKAPYGGPVLRPAVKVLVFVLASAGLWAAGHPVAGVGLLAFSAVVNAAAQHRTVRELVPA